MAELRMTSTRAALLRAVADPNVEVYAAIGGLRGSWSTADVWIKEPGRFADRRVTSRAAELESARLIERGPVGVRYHTPRHYTLTDDGRRVLDALDSKD